MVKAWDGAVGVRLWLLKNSLTTPSQLLRDEIKSVNYIDLVNLDRNWLLECSPLTPSPLLRPDLLT